MNYDIYGPISIPHDDGFISKLFQDFWTNHVETVREGLSRACGCYVFAVRSGGGIMPWYVGMNASDGGFRSECFQTHKLQHYNEALRNYDRGTPVLFLIPRLTPTRNFASPHEREIEFVETWLMATALRKNPDLKNKRDTGYLRDLHIRGIFNPAPGEANSESSLLKGCLGL